MQTLIQLYVYSTARDKTHTSFVIHEYLLFFIYYIFICHTKYTKNQLWQNRKNSKRWQGSLKRNPGAYNIEATLLQCLILLIHYYKLLTAGDKNYLSRIFCRCKGCYRDASLKKRRYWVKIHVTRSLNSYNWNSTLHRYNQSPYLSHFGYFCWHRTKHMPYVIWSV